MFGLGHAEQDAGDNNQENEGEFVHGREEDGLRPIPAIVAG